MKKKKKLKCIFSKTGYTYVNLKIGFSIFDGKMKLTHKDNPIYLSKRPALGVIRRDGARPLTQKEINYELSLINDERNDKQ